MSDRILVHSFAWHITTVKPSYVNERKFLETYNYQFLK